MCRFEDYPDETETILFDSMASKGPSGKASDGIIVFVDWNSGIDVKQGEMWICKLRRNASIVSTNYFAWPIDRVGTDGSERETLVVAGNGTVTIAGDSVHSDALPDGMYEVYRSLNGRCLELRKGADGDIPCKDGTMRLEGLKAILVGGPLGISLLTMDEGHFIIKLEQRNDSMST